MKVLISSYVSIVEVLDMRSVLHYIPHLITCLLEDFQSVLWKGLLLPSCATEIKIYTPEKTSELTVCFMHNENKLIWVTSLLRTVKSAIAYTCGWLSKFFLC